VFSNSFSEGRERDINEVFPSHSDPYAEHYDYLSDSDLEDESSCSEGEDEESLEGERDSQRGPENTPNRTVVTDPPSPVETSEAQNDNRSTPFTIECSLI